MKSTLKLTAGALLAAHLLAGCGGSSDSAAEPEPAPAPPPPVSAFTKKAAWTFLLPASGNSICYDFDTEIASATCDGTGWDVKVTSSGMTGTFFTNSGSSGSGAGGALGGPFDNSWTELSAWPSGTTDAAGGTVPARAFLVDSARSVFTGSNAIGTAAFEYGLGGAGDHLLYPSYRTFLITADSASADPVGSVAAPVYALQVIGYYGGASGTASGYPKIRWVDRAESSPTVQEMTVDASAGWAYVNLATGTTTTADGDWHIAFNRYSVRLNGGTSGDGKVGGFVGKLPAGLYDAEGNAVASALLAATPASTLADLTATDMTVPAAARNWVSDSLTSPLAPAYRGAFADGVLDYGWYKYYARADTAAAAGLPAVAHVISANPERAAMVRGGEETSYARMHLTSIVYADTTSASSPQTWTVEFDVQPKP